ncbi:hypothetical protein Tco_1027987 [Tanacetum coccineum]
MCVDKDKNVNAARPKAVVNAVGKSVVKVVNDNNVNAGNPQMDLQDKGVIDSGCSRHMTRNMSYLTDYEEIDGGYVAFGGKPQRRENHRKEELKKVIYALKGSKLDRDGCQECFSLWVRLKRKCLVYQPPIEDPDFPNRVIQSGKGHFDGLHQVLELEVSNEFYGWKSLLLRVQVKQKEDGIFISQDKYVTAILKKFGFTDVKTASTPMETQMLLLKDEDGEEVDVHLYRSMIGSLMYLTSSRPDIIFAVCVCARYQVNPKVSHLHASKRIFRHNLLLLLEVNAARHNLLLLLEVNAARHKLTTAVES